MATTKSATYKANAEKEGFSWEWDAKVGRYKLTGSKGLIGWFKSLARVRSEIAEVRFVAKGNLPKEYRGIGYTAQREWSGVNVPTYRLEFRGKYIGNFRDIAGAVRKAREHESNRWN